MVKNKGNIMRVIFNHLTIGLIYRDFWRLGPAFIGTLVSLLYQLINLYGFLPALFLISTGTAMIITVLTYTLYLLSLFYIPVPICAAAAGLVLAASFLAWLFINININRQADLRILVLNYSSRTAFIGLSILLCNQVLPLTLGARARFWDVHFKPELAGKIQEHDAAVLKELLQEDLFRLQKILKDHTVLYGCTPGSLFKYLPPLSPNSFQYQIIKTIIPPENARVFTLIRDFYFHVLTLDKK